VNFIRTLRLYSEIDHKVEFSFHLQRWLSDMGVIFPADVFVHDFLDFDRKGHPSSPEAVWAALARSDNETYSSIAKTLFSMKGEAQPDASRVLRLDADQAAKTRNRAKDLVGTGQKFVNAVGQARKSLPELGLMWHDAVLRKVREGMIARAKDRSKPSR
jgi:hypothetical protein